MNVENIKVTKSVILGLGVESWSAIKGTMPVRLKVSPGLAGYSSSERMPLGKVYPSGEIIWGALS